MAEVKLFTSSFRWDICAMFDHEDPLIWRQLTMNKAFKGGSSFCSLTRLNLQNEDPIGFASVDNEQSV